MRKSFSDIHFSIHSILIKKLAEAELDLQKTFYHWICRGAAETEENEHDSYDQISWLESPISKTDFPEGIEWRDVRDYAETLPLKKKSLSQTENEEYKILRMETAESLFDRFLHEGLNNEQKTLVEDVWNQTYNSFPQVDYENFDYSLYGFSETYNGKPFVFHEQQTKGMAFLCTKENGLLAYDVGVGKTATGIASVIYQMQHGKCERPLIIVPKAVYSKWVHDIKELFPCIPLNELENLNNDVIDRLRMDSVFADNNEGFLLPKNSISVCTAEGTEKILFNEDSCDYLRQSFRHILTKEKVEEALIPPKELSLEQFVYAEKLGIDLLLVDEAHRYKNLIKKVTGCGHSEFAKLGYGEPSVRAVKMFALTEYIHHVSNGKNVFFLSATPFTNSPMEIYSTLLFIGGEELRKIGYENINDFLNEFAEIKIEWSVNNKNQVVRKTVMKNFRSLDALQHLIQHYIDKVDAEEAKINRPQKETHVVKIEMTDLQKEIYDYEIDRISSTNQLGKIFAGMNAMRMLMISPTLVSDATGKIKIPAMDKFVTSSPKLMLVSRIILNVYKARPECGQIVYLPRGVKESLLLKKFLEAEGIPGEAIAMINSATTEKRKLKITQEFNDPSCQLKILIGSETISEGVDLNGNTLVLYNCMLGWNPTEPVQVEGRLWRQGNRQKKVHVVYPLMYNSLDSLIYQKHDEKASRIDAVWSYRGDRINVEEINPEELKFDLIKSPEMKAALMIEHEAIPIKRKLRIIEETRTLITQAQVRYLNITKENESLQKQIEKNQNDIQAAVAMNKDKPEAFDFFTKTLADMANKEIQELQSQIDSNNKKKARVESNIDRKMKSAGGATLEQLDEQEASLKDQLAIIQGKKNQLVQLYTAQYQSESQTKLHSVDAVVEELTGKILGCD